MKDEKWLAWLAGIIDDEPQRANCSYSYRRTRALEIIARCQLKQTQIIEQSFEENKKEAKEAERRYKETEEIISG